MRFHLAALDTETQIRERIEFALADHLYHQERIVGDFQEKGIHYSRRAERESPLQVSVTASTTIRGLPESLMV
jgi:hypothetical protein